MSELHPSQITEYLQLYSRAKLSSWGCLVVAIALLSLGVSHRKEYKPWLFGASTAVLILGSTQRKTVRQLQESLGDIEQISRLNFQSWMRSQTSPTAQLAVTIPAISPQWQPDNLISDPVEYIQKKQKHVALVGGTGDGKSTFTQYLSSKIGGRVIVYDSDAKPDDWAWLNQNDVIGRKGNFDAINEAMGNDLTVLEELVQLRGEGGDNAIKERDRFLIAEEFPVLVDECDNAARWIKRHAKRGRRYKQFITAIAQNDTAENFGLQGDKDTLYSCFCLVRLGSFGREYARLKLKDSLLEQWLKQGGKKRFMVDDQPCELDLSNWGMVSAVINCPVLSGTEQDNGRLPELNEYEQAIIEVGKKLQGDVIKARYLQQNSRLFLGMSAEDIRILFQSLADKGIGEVVGQGDRLGWYLPQSANTTPTNHLQ